MSLTQAEHKILIVDDKAENIIFMIEILRPLNLNIFVALNAQEAYSILETHSFDLILLDIIMPDINGYEICKKLKQSSEYKDIPLIFISALTSIDDRIKGFSYGADDYITKPLLGEELIARVNLHLQKGLLLKSLKQLLRKSYHELYNPLAIINTSLELQVLKYSSTKYTDAINVATKTLQIVYDDLYYSLSPSSHTQKYKNYIDLHTFVSKRIEYFNCVAESKSLTIKYTNSGTPIVNMKEADLLRVIDNTLANAIKYADRNSTIYIDTAEEESYLLFSSHNIGSEIKDTKKIFSLGHRESYKQIGMGIGLEIVASICNSYGININVISENCKTTFEYKIPKNELQGIVKYENHNS